MQHCCSEMRDVTMVSPETLPTDDGRARSIVLAFEIHICWKVLKKKQDRPSDPHRVLSVWWSNHLDHRRGWRQLRRFLCHAVTNLLEHGGATWQHDRNVRIHANVNATLHDVVKRSVVDSADFLAG